MAKLPRTEGFLISMWHLRPQVINGSASFGLPRASFYQPGVQNMGMGVSNLWSGIRIGEAAFNMGVETRHCFSGLDCFERPRHEVSITRSSLVGRLPTRMDHFPRGRKIGAENGSSDEKSPNNNSIWS
jgi:hypothetical protein